MLLSQCIIPCNSIIQRPIKTFTLFTIYSLAIRIRIRFGSWHKVAIIEKLITRSYIEIISDSKRQFYFGIENSIQHSIALLQIQILTLKVIVVAPLLIGTHRILAIATIFVTISRVRTVSQHIGIPVIRTKIYRNITVTTILKINVRSYFQPVGYFAIHLQIGTDSIVIIASHGSLIL